MRFVRVGLGMALCTLLLAAGCGGSPAGRAGGEALAGRAWPVGVELVVAEHESRPEGVRTRRFHWRLAQADSAYARFERRRDDQPADREPTSEWVTLRDGVPEGRLGVAGRGRVYGGGPDPRPVRVPAGRFRCTRTVRSYEASDGAMMRVDEWWTPGMPVPVQRWVRWEGIADSIGGPPRRADQLPVGTTWAVLESVRLP